MPLLLGGLADLGLDTQLAQRPMAPCQLAQRIYFRRAGSLMVYDLARREQQTLWPQRSPDDEDAPAISRDGHTVFFVQGGNLWALASDSTTPRRLTSLGRTGDEAEQAPRCDRPMPSPDGHWLAYRVVRPGDRPQIRLYDLTTDEDRVIAEVDDFSVSWAPDGGLVYTAGGRIWQRNPPDSMPRPLIPDFAAEGVQAAPHFARDGRLLFTCDRQPMVRLTNGRVMTAAILATDTTRAWSTPRGEQVALERWLTDPRDARRSWSELSVVDPTSRRPRVVMSTYAASGRGGRAEMLGWMDAERMLVLRDMYENCRKVYAVNAVTARADLVLKGQDRDAGFAVWPN
ncbi:MAG: hypothetical protein HZB16_20110 [Armatimonadetes bacterium]|nr:hypothetical protein [Armatimonadota bacterium]